MLPLPFLPPWYLSLTNILCTLEPLLLPDFSDTLSIKTGVLGWVLSPAPAFSKHLWDGWMELWMPNFFLTCSEENCLSLQEGKSLLPVLDWSLISLHHTLPASHPINIILVPRKTCCTRSKGIDLLCLHHSGTAVSEPVISFVKYGYKGRYSPARTRSFINSQALYKHN